jgi:AbrB family looped-hinge helix DNA binding protein
MVMKSTLTSKGQTTIPSKIRKQLNLKAGDGLAYTVEGDHVIIRPVRGTLMDAFASVKPKRRPEDFSAVRRQAKSKRARKIAGKK